MAQYQTPGVTTRSRTRMSPSPFGTQGREDWVADDREPGTYLTPRPKRSAQVFGTPLSVARSVLEDVTNDSAKAGLVNKTPKPAEKGSQRSASKMVKAARSATKQAQASRSKTSGDNAKKAAADVEESSVEDLLREEVSKLMAELPAEMETPVLVKSKPATKDQDEELCGSTNLLQGSAIDSKAEGVALLCFSPTTLMAPTPNNTPVGGLVARHSERLSAAAVTAGLSRLGAAKHSKGHSLPTLHIATPIGKTPPPGLKRQGSMESDPAQLLKAIAALKNDEITSPSSSPERPSRALTFDSPPTRSLPSSPKLRRTESGSRVAAESGSLSSRMVPPSPAWSLDVNISTPALRKVSFGPQQMDTICSSQEVLWEEDLGGEEEEEEEEEEPTAGRKGSLPSKAVEHWDCAPEEQECPWDEEAGDEDVCEAMAELSVSGRSVPLRGLPGPSGSHVRFEDEED